MDALPTTFIKIDNDQLVGVIETAQQWLIYIAPGVHVSVAEAIAERWQVLGPERVQVILDVDPEVARLGYGYISAIEYLQEVARRLGSVVRHQPGIRIGILVVDQSTIVFAATPLLIEAGSTQEFQPNALAFDFVPPAILREVGWGEQGNQERVIGQVGIDANLVEQVRHNLEANPPMRFDVARKTRVFNAFFEFVEFELEGALISRRKVAIPNDLLGLVNERTRRQLRTTYQLVDDRGRFTNNSLFRIKQWIVDCYLIQLKGYGWVVLRAKKPEFEKSVEKLRRYILFYQKTMKQRLQEEIDRNRQDLEDELLSRIIHDVPRRWMKFLPPQPQSEDVRMLLREELQRAFGTAEQILGEAHVNLLFKGVTYELLSTPDFIESARKAIPQFRKLHEEFDAARAEQLDLF